MNLVRKNTDNVLYALKTIDLDFLNPKERKLAENEAWFLKVLVGPTLVRFYESFIDQDKISIVMEFAEGGSLADKIEECIKQGKDFDTEEILMWTA